MKPAACGCLLLAALASGCATLSPVQSQLNLEGLITRHEAVEGVAKELSDSCLEWSRGGPESRRRAVGIYDRLLRENGLLPEDLAELLERRPAVKDEIERVCGQAHAGEFLSRLRESALGGIEFSPTPDTVEKEPIEGDLPREPIDAEILEEPRQDSLRRQP